MCGYVETNWQFSFVLLVLFAFLVVLAVVLMARRRGRTDDRGDR